MNERYPHGSVIWRSSRTRVNQNSSARTPLSPTEQPCCKMLHFHYGRSSSPLSDSSFHFQVLSLDEVLALKETCSPSSLRGAMGFLPNRKLILQQTVQYSSCALGWVPRCPSATIQAREDGCLDDPDPKCSWTLRQIELALVMSNCIRIPVS